MLCCGSRPTSWPSLRTNTRCWLHEYLFAGMLVDLCVHRFRIEISRVSTPSAGCTCWELCLLQAMIARLPPDRTRSPIEW